MDRRDFTQYGFLLTASSPLLDTRLLSAVIRAEWTHYPALSSNLQSLTLAIEREFHLRPPTMVLSKVEGHLQVLEGLFEGAVGNTRIEILRLASRTATMAGWLASRMENRYDALFYCNRACVYGAAGADRESEARALIMQSSLHSHVPHGDDNLDHHIALGYLNKAESKLDSSTSIPLLGTLHAWRAEEHAAAGSDYLVDKNLDAVATAIAKSRSGARDLIGQWDESLLTARKGNCDALLGNFMPTSPIARQRSQQAIDTLTKFVNECRPGELANRSAILGNLTIAYANQGAIEEASQWLSYYISVAVDSGIPRRIRRAARVRKHLDPWAYMPTVKIVDDQLQAALSSIA